MSRITKLLNDFWTHATNWPHMRKGRNYNYVHVMVVTSMLVTDVGDESCCKHRVGDKIWMLESAFSILLENIHYLCILVSGTFKIYYQDLQHRPTIFVLPTLNRQHYDVTNVTATISTKTNINSHLTRKGNAWKFVKTLHVKFFPFGCGEPPRKVTVNINWK